MSDGLKKTIDRMVEDAIRRILPGVMNEVLIRTLANSGALTERARPERTEKVRKKPGPKPKVRPVREERAAQRTKPPSKRSLSRVLEDLRDETAGADYFRDPNERRREAAQLEEEYEVEMDDLDEEPERPVSAPRAVLESLPPEIRAMAEGVTLDDDDGEMWDEPGPALPGRHDEVPDITGAARHVGVDFSRMKSVIAKTEGKVTPRKSAEDRQAEAEFETNRLKRMRERLDTPVR